MGARASCGTSAIDMRRLGNLAGGWPQSILPVSWNEAKGLAGERHTSKWE